MILARIDAAHRLSTAVNVVTAMAMVSTAPPAAAVEAAAVEAAAVEAGAVKFAFYSASWREDAADPLRLVAFNPLGSEVRIETIDFVDIKLAENESLELDLALDVPAGGYAERELAHVDLLGRGECVGETLAGNWRLVEISNYMLNPSVRNLIIENTESFRIYQCVQTVETRITNVATGSAATSREWVLYHFEALAGD